MKKTIYIISFLLCNFAIGQVDIVIGGTPSPKQIIDSLNAKTGDDRIDVTAIKNTSDIITPITLDEYNAMTEAEKIANAGRQVVDENGEPTAISVVDGSITTAKIANSAISSAKILDETITESKLGLDIQALLDLAENSVQTRTPEGFYSPKDYGVVTDGSVNTSVSFQSFVDILPENSSIWIAPNDTILISNVTISTNGLTFTGGGTIIHDDSVLTDSDASDESAIEIDNVDNIVFDRLKFKSSYIYYNNGRGILEFNTSKDSEVKNCYFTEWSTVVTYNSYNVRIKGNYFDESRIHIRDSDYCSADYNYVKLTDTRFAGVQASISITDTSFERFGSTINNNYVVTNLGISSYKGNTGGSMSGNEIIVVEDYNSYTIPISAADVRDFKINNNSIRTEVLSDNRDSDAYGLELANVKGATVSGNSVSNLGKGIIVDGRDLGNGVEEGLAEDIVITGNRVDNCGQGIIIFRGVRNITVIGNTVNVNSNYGETALTSDDLSGYSGIYPMNVNITNNTFTIENTSLASITPITLRSCDFSFNEIIIKGDSDVIAIYPGENTTKAKITNNKITSESTGIVYGVSFNNSSSGSSMYEYVDNVGKNLYKHITFHGSRGNIPLRISDNIDIGCDVSSQEWDSDYFQITSNDIKFAHNSSIPTAGSWEKGSRIFSSNSNDSWICTTKGSFGTTVATLTGVSGDFSGTVSSISGLYIGFTFITDDSVTYTIKEIDYDNLLIYLNKAIVSDLTSSTMTVVNPVFESLSSADLDSTDDLPEGSTNLYSVFSQVTPGDDIKVRKLGDSSSYIELDNTSTSPKINLYGGTAGNYASYILSSPTSTWKNALNTNQYTINDVTNGNNVLALAQSAPANSINVISSGNLGIGVTNPTQKLHVSGSVTAESYISTATAPATATDTGTVGEIRYDGSYIYRCTATDTWVRTPVTYSTF